MAFSWGHPGAELLSKESKSGDSPLDIDLYIGIEPEDFLRWCIFADCTATNTFDAGMVVGIYAADTGSSKTEYRDTDGNIDEKLKEHGIDTPSNWKNGLNGLHNSSGGEERNHEILASVLARWHAYLGDWTLRYQWCWTKFQPHDNRFDCGNTYHHS